MKEVIVDTSPPSVSTEDFEDLLVTSTLFIDYLNGFLSCPSFLEPLCFNKELATFEIVSEKEQRLKDELKAALRKHRRKNPVYKHTKKHSFSTIPLILIDESLKPKPADIKTSFTVKTLNREQGLQWVKRERLPLFFESDTYQEYRLALLLAQAHKFTAVQPAVSVKVIRPLDQPQVDEDVIDEAPSSEQDENDALMYRMFVSLGDTSPSQTDAWLSQARAAHQVAVETTSSIHRPISAAVPLTRPASAAATTKSQGLSAKIVKVQSRGDSGFGGSSTIHLQSLLNAATLCDVSIYAPELFPADDTLSGTPAPEHISSMPNLIVNNPLTTGESLCAIAPEPPKGSVRVYQTTPHRLQIDEDELSSEKLNEIAHLITARVLIGVLTSMTGMSRKEVEDSDMWRVALKMEEHPPAEDILMTESERHIKLGNNNVKQESNQDDHEPDEKPHLVIGEQNVEEQEEAVLNSDDDFEADDVMFRKTSKPLSLKTLKGVEAFKLFIANTEGERDWNLWKDIEMAKNISNADDLRRYLQWLRDVYHNTGAPLELPMFRKVQLRLIEPSRWNVAHLSSIQPRLTEALALYWAPRFLIRQTGTKFQLPLNYEPYKGSYRQTAPGYMSQPVFSRPKSCMPRIQTERPNENTSIEEVTTSPPKPQGRVYNLPPWYNSNLYPKPEAPKETPRPIRRPRKLLEASLTEKIEAAVAIVEGPDTSSIGEPLQHNESNTSSKVSSEVVLTPEMIKAQQLQGLMLALKGERRSGRCIRKFIYHDGNKLWRNCLNMWEKLQEYHKQFYLDRLNPFDLRLKAKAIYMKHLASNADEKIKCPDSIRQTIFYKLNPPFEDLFDMVECGLLDILGEAWSALLKNDLNSYSKVGITKVKRQIIDSNSKVLAPLRRRGMIKERSASIESLSKAASDSVYDTAALLEQIPEEFRDWDLDKLVHSRLELEHFRNFLDDNYASVDLMCWMDIETFKRIPHTDEKRREMKRKDIKTKYFNKKYFFGPNSPAGKEGQQKVIEASGGWGHLLDDQLNNETLLMAQTYVKERLEKKWMLLFLATKEFAERQKPQVEMDDVVDDVLTIKRKKSQAIWKLLESKWVSSSKDIMTFRQALNNPLTSQQFKKYVSIKGDNFENDVVFYHEVQKYKDLCHLHSDRALMQQKTQAIINCFVDSPIPPAIQIDIPQDVADRLVERKMEASPYLFLEAQLTVFRILLGYWSEFCTFRASLTEEKLMPTIERHRKRVKILEKKKQKLLEGKRAEEEARRIALGLPPGTSLEEPFDPFESYKGDEDKTKATKTFAYSQYIKAIDGEDYLNMVDSLTFASLDSQSFVESESRATPTARDTASKTRSNVVKGKNDSADNQLVIPKNKQVNWNGDQTSWRSNKVDLWTEETPLHSLARKNPVSTRPKTARNQPKTNTELSGRPKSAAAEPYIAQIDLELLNPTNNKVISSTTKKGHKL